MKTKIIIGIILAAAVAALLYFKPWRKKSKDYLNLTEVEKARIDFYMHGGLNYSYEDALNKVLMESRVENKGVSGWSDDLNT